MIIGLSGYIGSGKDTVAQMIIDITTPQPHRFYEDEFGRPARKIDGSYDYKPEYSPWINKKFAAKLKQIASILTGIPVENFESQDFKKTYLPPMWDYRRRLPRESLEQENVYYEDARMTVREFLQRLGTEAMRDNLHTNVWVNALFTDYGKRDNWIVSDVRFPNEAEAVKRFGGVVVRINRTLPNLPYRVIEQKHPSETSLDDWKFDYEIDNNGTLEDLRKKVQELIGKMNEVNLVRE